MSYNTSDSHRCYLQNLYNTFWGMTIFTKCFIINCRGIVVNDNHKVMSMVSPYKDKKTINSTIYCEYYFFPYYSYVIHR